MPIADYASRIRSAILETPHVVSHSLAYEDRPPVAGIVRGSAAFVDGSVLHFKEFLQLSPTVIRLKYAYQYVMTDGSLNFRYDNARDPAARRLSHTHIISTCTTTSILLLVPHSQKPCKKPLPS